MENWDLQAVVRGFSTTTSDTIDHQAMEFSQEHFCFPPLTIQEEEELFQFDFPQIFGSAIAFDELEDLYKPFYPIAQATSPPTSIVTSSISVPQEVLQEEPKKRKNSKESSTICKKSKKNQNKRVVKEVKAEDLFSDVWAWRKYGQKPIKGSPYPRSYYRCSSSKGCSARKQVERSCLNPETFIVTYTAEHNHSHPTRRNSLAGSTRSKFPSSKLTKHKPNNDSSNRREFVESAGTAIAVKEEAQISGEDEISHESATLDDVMLGDEFSPSLEVLDLIKLEGLDELIAEERAVDGWFSDQVSDNFPSPWLNFGHSNNTVTGAC